MAKALLALLFLIACPALAFRVSVNRGIEATNNAVSLRPRTNDLTKAEMGRHPIYMLRGGGADVNTLAVAVVAVAAAATHGILNVFAPSVWERFTGFETSLRDDSSLPTPRFFHRMTGVVSIGEAITIYTSLLGKFPTNKVIGLSLLPRVLVSTLGFATRSYKEINVTTKFLLVNTIMMTWISISNLFLIGNSALSAKIFTTLAMFKALLMLLSPIAGASKFFGVDVSNRPLAKNSSLVFGQFLTFTAVHLCSLAYGIEPTQAAINSFAVWLGLMGSGMLFRDM